MGDKLAYSVKEAAEMLSISPWLLKEQIDQGRIQSVKIGRRRVVPHWVLEEWLKAKLSGAGVSDVAI